MKQPEATDGCDTVADQVASALLYVVLPLLLPVVVVSVVLLLLATPRPTPPYARHHPYDTMDLIGI